MNSCAVPGCDRTPLADDRRCEHHVSDDPQQIGLFDGEQHESWQQHWKGMPEFTQLNLEPLKSIIVHFASSADIAEFAKLVDQRITFRTQSIWYPEAEIGHFADKRYANENTHGQKAIQ